MPKTVKQDLENMVTETDIKKQLEELTLRTEDLKTVLIWLMQETETHEKFKNFLNVRQQNSSGDTT